MYIFKLPNAAASKISVTSTATSLLDLVETAASTVHGLPLQDINAIDIVVEDGDVRVLFEGNTPTAANGVLMSSGVLYSFRGVPLTTMNLIRTGSSDVACSIQVGHSEEGESSNAMAYAVTLEATSITVGDVGILPLAAIGNGQNTVASAGTAEVLATTDAISSVTIKALAGNTGDIYVGDSGVDSTNGYTLSPGDAISLDIDDPNKVYIDAGTTSDGVSFVTVASV